MGRNGTGREVGYAVGVPLEPEAEETEAILKVRLNIALVGDSLNALTTIH